MLGKISIPQRLRKSRQSEDFDDSPGSPFSACSDIEKSRRSIRYREFVSRVGRRYESASLETFEAETGRQKAVLDAVREYVERVNDRIESGQGILFFGPKGTGKDHLAVAVAKATLLRGFTAHWSNGLDWFGDLRDGMERDARESSLINRLARPSLLVLSDPLPLTGELTQHQSSQLWRVIDRRYRDMKPTVVTMNVASRKEAEERMGAALVDRLAHGALALFCNWESYRSAK